MVVIHYQGRFGNQLFQYSAGRLLADDKGSALWAMPVAHFSNAKAIPFPWVSMFLRNPIVCEGHRLDWNFLRNAKRSIVMNGFFARYEYYKERKQEIRGFFSRPFARELPEDHLTIHIRSGDIWASGSRVIHPDYCALPLSYYERIIRQRSWSEISIVCETSSDIMAKTLEQKFGAKVVSTGNQEEDFEYLRASRNLVMAVSSFSWWAAFLSRASYIAFPIAGIFDNEHLKNRLPEVRPNYLINDESRFQMEKVNAPLPWRGTSDQLQWLLQH